MFSNDDRSGPREAAFTQPGPGLVCAWECFGCKRRISTSLGARGLGLQRRCAQCIEAKNKGQIEMFFLDRLKPEFAKDPEGRTANDKLRAEVGRAPV